MHKIPISTVTLGEEEKKAVNEVLDSGWLTLGKYTNLFEEALKKYLHKKYVILTNSGTSAAWLGITALKSLKLLTTKDKAITCANSFPTTISALMHYGIKTKLVDTSAATWLMDFHDVHAADLKKVKLMIIPHTAGNIANLEVLYNVQIPFVLEDGCDALGGLWKNEHIGDKALMSIYSFYTAHQVTGGDGGCIATNDDNIYETVLSLNHWGRVKQAWKYSSSEFDKRFTYINWGFNTKINEIVSAIAYHQLQKLPENIKIRNNNAAKIRQYLAGYKNLLAIPYIYEHATPSWMMCPIRVISTEFNRKDIVMYLEDNGIECRPILAGNLTKQQLSKDFLEQKHPLPNSDGLYSSGFMVGCHHGLNDNDIIYMLGVFDKFLEKYKQ